MVLGKVVRNNTRHHKDCPKFDEKVKESFCVSFSSNIDAPREKLETCARK